MTQKPYLFTDLDRTMVFSKRFLSPNQPLIPVEYKGKTIISYMTPQALKLTQQHIKNIIPVTTRTLEEFKRVKPYQEAEWAIVGNGSIILHHGQPLPEWGSHIAKQITPIQDEYTQIVNWLNQDYPHYLNRLATERDSFIFAKVRPENKKQLTQALCDKLETLPQWHFVIQKQKVYIIPKVISKENAIEHLINLLKPRKIYFAGDGSLDINMINLSQTIPNAHSFTPENTDAHKGAKTQNLTIVSNQPNGAEEILQHVFSTGTTHAI